MRGDNVAFKIRLPEGLGQLFFVIAVIGGALTLSEVIKPRPSEAESAKPAGSFDPSVRLVRPDRLAYAPKVALSGVVENRTKTDISPQVGGRVVFVSDRFKAGHSVGLGEELFRIDPQDYELALESSRAEIAAAKGELLQLRTAADLAVREWKEVYPDRDPPPLTARVPQITAVEARLMAAEANRKKAELALERTVVRAPFAGRILQTQLDVGQLVSPGQNVGAAFAFQNIEIAAPVSAQEMALLEPALGRRAMLVRSEGAAAAGEGRIVRLDAQLDARTRLARLFIAVDDVGSLTVGEFLRVEVGSDPVDDAIRAPASALSGRDGVWVVEGGRLAARKVAVLGVEGSEVFLAPFDTADGIVAIPPPDPAEGMTVRITQPEGGVANAG